jgi:hypothetical protein
MEAENAVAGSCVVDREVAKRPAANGNAAFPLGKRFAAAPLPLAGLRQRAAAGCKAIIDQKHRAAASCNAIIDGNNRPAPDCNAFAGLAKCLATGGNAFPDLAKRPPASALELQHGPASARADLSDADRF